jgi:UDP-glucose 4,6-dehydratase
VNIVATVTVTVIVVGTGRNFRSYLYVDDVADAFDRILHHGVIGEIYNIGSDIEVENRVVLEKLISLARARNLLSHSDDGYYVQYVKDRAFNDFRYYIDSAALRALGWECKYGDFDQALSRTMEWYLNVADDYWPNIRAALRAHPHLSITSLTGKSLPYTHFLHCASLQLNSPHQ